ncbi:MAG: hypothetical protein ABIW76_06615 [Fibrobacteria bacterium]
MAAGVGSSGFSSLYPGTTSLRHVLREDNTPLHTVTCRRGGGTMAERRESKALASREILRVPSFHARLNSKARFAPCHSPILHKVQPLVGQRWAKNVPAQHLPVLPIVGGHTAGGMQVERGILGAEIALEFGTAIAGHGGEGDHALLLQVAEDPFAGPRYHGLNVILSGGGRGLEDRSLPIWAGSIRSVQEQSMEMRTMLMYGSDKPDLRIPIEIRDVSALFAESTFKAFKAGVAAGLVVRAIPVKSVGDKPRAFFDRSSASCTSRSTPR